MIMAGEGVHLLLLITAVALAALPGDSQCPQLPPHCRILSQVSMAGAALQQLLLSTNCLPWLL